MSLGNEFMGAHASRVLFLASRRKPQPPKANLFFQSIGATPIGATETVALPILKRITPMNPWHETHLRLDKRTRDTDFKKKICLARIKLPNWPGEERFYKVN
jgi:hypothetical protein